MRTPDICRATGTTHAAEIVDIYTWQCSACRARTTPMHPQAIAAELGPRTLGTRYREGGRTLVEVIRLDGVAFDMPAAWAVTVRELDGPDTGRVRRHCTAWTPGEDELVATVH